MTRKLDKWKGRLVHQLDLIILYLTSENKLSTASSYSFSVKTQFQRTCNGTQPLKSKRPLVNTLSNSKTYIQKFIRIHTHVYSLHKYIQCVDYTWHPTFKHSFHIALEYLATHWCLKCICITHVKQLNNTPTTLHTPHPYT